MNRQELPAPHLPPFQLEGLDWMESQKNDQVQGVVGVTHSLAVTRVAVGQLIKHGFVYANAQMWVHAGRPSVFSFAYGLPGSPGRFAEILLVAVKLTDMPLLEVVDKYGVSYGFYQHNDLPPVMSLLKDHYIRPTLK